jgi:hypothetical protein
MSCLAFLPWATIDAPTTISGIHLEPIFLPLPDGRPGAIEEAGGTVAQSPVLDVLAPYEVYPERRINSATLLRHEGKSLIDDLTDEEMEEIFAFNEALAFSALAGREYFFYTGYINRDSFSCVIQKFTQSGGIAVQTRRRDGTTTSFMPAGTYTIRREEHIKETTFTADAKLVAAVREAMEDESVFQAIQLFNDSNTDRSGVRQAQELVSIVSAFQQLLEIPGGKPSDTIREFREALSKQPQGKTKLGPRRAAKLKGRDAVRDTWMHDLCALRGSVGHGHAHKKYDSAWTPAEHLLLAAYIFPLLVKLQLVERKLYELTDDDRLQLFSLDYYLAADDDLLGGVVGEHGIVTKYNWNIVGNEARRDYRMARALAAAS